ncbi:MAG: hypothetical protein ACQER7_11965 [Bacteroidota bacterium]
MKKFNFFSLMVVALIMGLSFTSCEEDESLLATDEENGEETAPKIVVSEGELTDSASTTVYVSDLEEGAEEVDVNVVFSSETNMRRLYITRNIPGAGDEKFELNIEDLDKKGDGSVDLSRSEEATGFDFTIPFPISNEISSGDVEFKIWATSGRGDYRDMDKRYVAGPGTITIKYGGENPESVGVEEYEAKLLAAPLDDGSSETFISLVDGNVYAIKDGEEFAAYWDFGYYYGASGEIENHNASLASTSTYEETFQVTSGNTIVDVDEIAGTTELNDCFFASSTLTVDEFDAISNSSELDFISKSNEQSINSLEVGDVVEFVDNYGKKGLIKVTEINGTYNAGDYIKLDIKVQP